MDHNQLNCSHSVVSCSSICYDFNFDILVPTPTVSVTAPNTQTVGESLTLQCEVTTVRGITSRVDIVWMRNNTVVQTTNMTTTTTTMNNLLVYSDSYTISQLSTSDDNIEYRCRLAIRASPMVKADDTVTLDVTGEYFPENVQVSLPVSI